MRQKHLFILLLTAVILLGASPARSQPRPDEQPAKDFIHSDLPLFGDDTANKWPRPFEDGDSFGCITQVPFGDWILRELGAEDDRRSEWYKIRNYGVFHCWAMVGRAHRRDDLEGVELRPSFFVPLDTVEMGNTGTELWAVQIGAIPGSDYLLLSRPRNNARIEAFSVLQTQCPSANMRDAGAIDIIFTGYCSINTRADLIALARLMARRPPRGTLSLITTDGNGDDNAGE